MSLESFQNNLARDIFGISKYDAHERKICISCKTHVDQDTLAEIDLREYNISGLCPACWNNLMGLNNGN